MDPLSIAGTALAVATIASQVTTGLVRLRSDIAELPGRLDATNNEVEDLKLVLHQLSSLAQESVSLTDDELLALQSLLERAAGHLKDISSVTTHVQHDCESQKYAFMRVKAWRKWQKRLQALQGSIQDVRANLNIIIASHTS